MGPALLIVTVGASLHQGADIEERLTSARPRTVSSSWIRQFGTAATDWAWSVATDGSGDVIVVGETSGRLPGQDSGGGSDAFVRKYGPAGDPDWTRQFGSSELDAATAVATDPAGDIYVVGWTYGALPGQSHGLQRDVFIRKLSPSGAHLWTRQYGTDDPGGGDDVALGVAVDDLGNAFVVGMTNGSLPGHSNLGDYDAFVRGYGPGGDVLWTRQFGSSAQDWATAVAIGPGRGAHVAGVTWGALPGVDDKDGTDAFLRRYTADGSTAWTRLIGTGADDKANAVIVDGDGDSFVAGWTAGAFPGRSRAGPDDAFVSAVGPDGQPSWAVQFGSAQADQATSIAITDDGRLVIAGDYASSLPMANGSEPDSAFIATMTRAGSSVDWTLFGATGNMDWANGVASHGSRAYLVGATFGTLPDQLPLGGGDAFVARYDIGATASTMKCAPGTKAGTVTIAAGSEVSCTFTPGTGATFTGWTATRFTPASSATARRTFTAGTPGTGSIVGKYRDGAGPHTVTWSYRLKSLPVAEKSTLVVDAGRPVYVPADDKASTVIVAKLRDAAGNPVPNRKVILERSTLTSFAGFRRVRRAAGDGGAQTTLADGRARFTVRGGLPGPVTYKLIDITGGGHLDLNKTVTVEFTRKVVVLVMGMKSSLDERIDYWGTPSDSTPAIIDTTYEAFRHLGYRHPLLGVAPGTYETLLDGSWNAADCALGDGDDGCVATIDVDGTNVTWTPAPYALGWPQAFGYWKELRVDQWATKLVRTLMTYEQSAYEATGIHTSFYLVGHSMGGQLVVRVLDKAIDKDLPVGRFFRDPTRRGMLQAVISLDGAANWTGDLREQRDLACAAKGMLFRTVLDDGVGKEVDNRANIAAAKELLGTRTVVITNVDDKMVPPAVATIDPKPSTGYKEYRYAGDAGDPCGHGNLKWRQASGITAVVGPPSQFPFFEVVLRQFVGQAVD